MAIRKYKPTTPGRRGSSVADFVEITRTTPEKSLTRPLPKKGGRNNQGRITTRHQGGGHKRAYRVIDFRRYDKDGVPGQGRAHRVRPQPHRPHRAAALRRRREALHHRAEGPAPGHDARVRPDGRHQGGQQPAAAQHPGRYDDPLHRAAARRRREDRPLRRQLAPSSSPRRARAPRCACRPARCGSSTSAAAPPIGEVGNAEQSNINWGKAGRMRWKGKRPTVRGVVMNPVDHPHGGGEGKTSGGRHPVSPVGQARGPHASSARPATPRSSVAASTGKKR